MHARSAVYGVLALCLVLTACSPKRPGVEINIPNDTKKSFASAHPVDKFAFYVIKGKEPKTVEDLKKRTLFVCCDAKIDDSQSGMAGALPGIIPYYKLFAGKQEYGIDKSAACDPSQARTQKFGFNGSINGTKAKFETFTILYCRKPDQVLSYAIEAVRKDANGVLLVPRGAKAPAPDLIELIFE